jgi:hypothetical protein
VFKRAFGDLPHSTARSTPDRIRRSSGARAERPRADPPPANDGSAHVTPPKRTPAGTSPRSMKLVNSLAWERASGGLTRQDGITIGGGWETAGRSMVRTTESRAPIQKFRPCL